MRKMKLVNVLVLVSLLACISHLAFLSGAKEIPTYGTNHTIQDGNYNLGQQYREGLNDPQVQAFNTFQLAYSRKYTPTESGQRMKLFLSRSKMVESWNSQYAQGKVSHKLKANHLADRTDQELAKLNGLITPLKALMEQYKEGPLKVVSEKLPDKVDYRRNGCRTEVRDQGDCGSCYAVATADLIAINHCLYVNPGIYGGRYANNSRSPQDIMDCGSLDEDHGLFIRGCNGGWPEEVLKFFQKTKHLAYEENYPYKAKLGECNIDAIRQDLPFSGYEKPNYLVLRSEDEFKEHLAKYGPVAAAVRTTNQFKLYDSGIFDDPTCGDDLWTHAVLVVGYGRESGKDYWIIKNSWGTDWGEKGFMKMIRGKHSCRIGKMGWGIPYHKSKINNW